MAQVSYTSLGLEEWEVETIEETMSDEAVSIALHSLQSQAKITGFLRAIAKELVSGSVDWRTSKAPSLTDEQRLIQGSYRGSSGYSALQQVCLRALVNSRSSEVAEAAKQVAALVASS
jgi:hypothetical protein